ncbi:2-oxoglutarate dehydrogenase E1 subunit family protein [Thermogemmatispora carboxidivorans]|uniref:2-oxoglutarate dehydrogenase E1 subunit family protein n=1 Tax=Thermogemmatispora carboxidivorans TaxID=1382306 RepID=UPI00192E445B|nr:hypothetical protein [Thermogemmatispora carboxidivorans]
MDNLQTFYGPNAGYVLDLYERYRTDPSAVDEKTRAIFARWRPVIVEEGGTPASGKAEGVPFAVEKVVAAVALAHAIRERGHLAAQLDPLGRPPQGDPALLPESHGLSEEDLTQLPACVVGGHAAEGRAMLWRPSSVCGPCIQEPSATSLTRSRAPMSVSGCAMP